MLKTLFSIFCLVVLSVAVNADTKVKSRQTSGGQTYENTSYIKGKRQRTESNGGQMVTVTQCDLRRNIQIMPEMKTYLIQPYDQPASGAAATTANPPVAATQMPAKKGGVVTSTITTRDTGERKQMFGYTARHIITTMEMEASPDACSPMKNKMEIDGWYIDAAFALDCDLGGTYTPPQRPQVAGGCRDRYESKRIGTAKTGFPVWQKTTMFGPGGAEGYSSINEVIEFSQATLDQSLFEVPEGYREVQDYASLYGAPSTPSVSPSTATTSTPTSTSASTASNTAAQTVGPKKAGMIRIGVVTVKTDKVAEGMNASNLATAVQTTLTDKLKAPNVEAIPIQATVLSQIEAEARQKECDYLVYATVSLKKGGGGFGSVFGNTAAQVAANTVGYGGSTAAAIAANAAATTVAADIKARDELTVDVRLEKPGAGYPAFSKQYKGKAKSAGEDIVTPPTTQAAQGILEAATKN
ncbi:MAG TPA: hypothetical protein VGW58_11770 [Pyrinomonadaceae bacterium]|nr:hypothetical protein [Pyrinomonadaceae bacterium]